MSHFYTFKLLVESIMPRIKAEDLAEELSENLNVKKKNRKSAMKEIKRLYPKGC